MVRVIDRKSLRDDPFFPADFEQVSDILGRARDRQASWRVLRRDVDVQVGRRDQVARRAFVADESGHRACSVKTIESC